MPDAPPREPRQRVAAAARDLGDARFVRAPGRLNLLGDHTDYNDGFVLPMAIDRETVAAFRPTGDGRVRVRSLDVDGPVDVAADGSDRPRDVAPAWGRYVAGVVTVLAARGRPPVGLEAVLASGVPVGSGLSSSAALEVAIALALAEVAAWSLPPVELARACQEAEHVATGVPCGIMDQLTALLGRAGRALLVDCRDLAVEPVPLPETLVALAVHSGLPRTLAGSAYADRRAECRDIARRLGLRSLRDATFDQVAGFPRARHVVSENARVLAVADALRRADLPALGPLLAASHASLRDDFEVSTPELDRLAELLVAAGALGARLTGAGFGGCVVALVEHGHEEAVVRDALPPYREATGLEPRPFVCAAVDGAGTLP